MANDKTEKPTPKKIRDARKEGQFPRTADAATWLAIAGGVAMLPRSGQLLADRFGQFMNRLPEVGADPTPAVALRVLGDLPLAVVVCAGPVAAAAAFGAILGMAAQGVYPSGKALKPKFSRLSPKAGVKRMFGGHAAWEAVKSLLKVFVIGLVVFLLGRNLIPQLLANGPLPLVTTVDRARHGLETTIWAATAAGLTLAFADYAYQRHSVMKQLRMSHNDIKDEMKQSEGDPAVKHAIRSRQLAISRNRMLSAVASADVVLVNPTQLAVALKYQAGRGAPRVVAKGAGALAAKIRALAREHRVPVVEDKPLARALHRVCEIDEEIPVELYLAVAKILAFVMSTGRPSRTARTSKPTVATEVPTLPNRGALRLRKASEVRAIRAARRTVPRQRRRGG